MKPGDVILTPVPQADGRIKIRPAIILYKMPPYNDLLVCGISTQVHHYVNNFDDIISPGHKDFISSGLFGKIFNQTWIPGTFAYFSHNGYYRLNLT